MDSCRIKRQFPETPTSCSQRQRWRCIQGRWLNLHLLPPDPPTEGAQRICLAFQTNLVSYHLQPCWLRPGRSWLKFYTRIALHSSTPEEPSPVRALHSRHDKPGNALVSLSARIILLIYSPHFSPVLIPRPLPPNLTPFSLKIRSAQN
jgi:hypothetical protein